MQSKSALVVFCCGLMCSLPAVAQQTAVADSAVSSCNTACGTCCPAPPKPVVYHGPTPFSKLKDRVDKLAQRLEQLDASVCTKPCAPDLAKDIAGMRSEIADLQTELQGRVDGHDAELKVLETKLAAVETEIARLQNRKPEKSGFLIGPEIGALGIWAGHCSEYFGLFVGPRLAYRPTDAFFLALDLDFMYGVGVSPFGAKARGGLGFRLVERLDLETGLNAVWVDLDPALRATSVFYMADVGVTYGWPRVYVGAYGLVGWETGACGTCFATGGMVKAAFLLP